MSSSFAWNNNPMNLTNHKIAECRSQMIIVLCATLVFGQGTAKADHGAASTLRFSAQPSDAELSSARVLDESLVPLDGPELATENQALAVALEGYANRVVLDDCSSLAQFADAYPASRWTGP